MIQGPSCPLTMVPSGDTPVRIQRICTGRQAEARLGALGILPGDTIQVCRNDRYNPMVVRIKGNQLVLGQDVAKNLWVG